MLFILGELATKRNIRFRKDIGSSLNQVVNIDAQRIKQILFNVIQNAIKFSHNDTSIKIKAELCPLESFNENDFGSLPEQYFRISVRIDGGGMSQN